MEFVKKKKQRDVKLIIDESLEARPQPCEKRQNQIIKKERANS